MAQPDRCPECGAECHAGVCPRCLIRLGIDGAGDGRSGRSWSNRPAGYNGGGTTAAGVLETLAASIGPVPRVLLRDTTPGEPSGPILRRPADDDDDSSVRYRIDGEIARGGMGAILKGRDPDLGRDVALKVLRDDYREDAAMVRRFVEEAQIGGQLQHPGIVPIYELGVLADRRPFFAMKLVKGHTLAQLLDARKEAADDRPRMLSIFESIAQTVAYAHARGVIHRDLKPSNVMVGAFGEVQVMDWGLAKVLPRGGTADDEKAGRSDLAETVIATARSGSDGPGLSQPGSAMGTPSYMSPEQARGETERVDERSDVFALGSILCEMLTGEPAFLGRSSGEIMRKAALGETADALGRLDGCGAEPELVAIARECLAREAEDRPSHAGAVAERITAYLAGVQDRLRAAELARAAESARAEEARRTAEAAEGRARSERRARRLTAALAASLLALAGLGGAGGWLLARQRADRLAATTRAVDDALGRAADLRGRALAAPVGELGGWAAALAEAHRAEDAVNQGAADAALRQRVATALAELERLRAGAEQRARHAAAERRLVARLTEIRIVAGIDENSEVKTAEQFAAAFREFGVDLETLDPEEAGAALANRPATAEIVAVLDSTLGPLPRAVPARWLQIARVADPDPWRNNVRSLVGRPPAERKEALKRLAADRAGLRGQTASGLFLLSTMLRQDGEAAQAAEVGYMAWLRAPDDFWVNWMIGMSSWQPGTGLTRPDEAVRYLTAAIAIRPENARTHYNLGQALRRQGKVDEAIAEYRETRRISPDRASPELLELLKEQGRLDEAVAEFREDVRLRPDSAAAHRNLGHALLAQGQLGEAVAEFREAIRIKPDSTAARCGLGNALLAEGKRDEAVAEFREAIRIGPNEIEAHFDLGCALDKRGQLDEAAAEFRKAIQLEPDRFEPHINLGVTLGEQGRLDEAIAEFREAIRIKPDEIRAYTNLSYALDLQEKPGDALAALRRAADLARPGSLKANNMAGRIRRLEQRIRVAGRLAAVLDGKDKLASPAEGLAFAQSCHNTKRYAAAARLWEQAFAADSGLAEDLAAANRYDAACSAAMAGAGEGEKEPPVGERERARWRRQAIAWLKADLARRAEQAGSGPSAARAEVAEKLLQWKSDPDLAGLRDAAAIAALPADEQAACRALWAEVDALLARSRGGRP